NLMLGPSRHSIVILPGIERMPLGSLRKLDLFVKEGGILIATRRIPAIVPGLRTTDSDRQEFQAIVQGLFNGTNAAVKFVENENDLGATLTKLLVPDAAVTPLAKDFGFVHRRTANADIYFVANTSNQKRSVEITFRSVKKGVESWDPMNGQAVAADVHRQTAESTTVGLDFEPYQSHVIVFSNEMPHLQRPVSSETVAKIDLSSDWRVGFGSQASVPAGKVHSWADDDATRYFSGIATYERSFDIPAVLPKTAVLDFGEGTPLDVQPTRNGMQTWYDAPIREAALIYVNGQKAGSLWCPPYRLDIASFLKAGRNELRILVGNTALNYMAGRKLPDYRLLNLRYGERFQAQDMDKVQPIASGLLSTPTLILTK
ncbi:MAG: glycosyl hydrolase, partial [Pyrinomonadaceae bacterium]